MMSAPTPSMRLAVFLQQAAGEPDDDDDQRHLDGDADHSDQRAHRPVQTFCTIMCRIILG